jgi:hypothetical protein
MAPEISLKWHPLELFDERFQRNLTALRSRDTDLAERLARLVPSVSYFIAAQGDTVYLGKSDPAGIGLIPDPMAAPAARNMLAGLFPIGQVTWSIAIAGLGYGWMWDRIFRLPCKVDTAPGHRPPIYLLTNDAERLWAVLHVLDWRELLSDPRFPIFVGPDAAQQLHDLLVNNPSWPQPRASVGVEPQVLSAELNAFLGTIGEAASRRTDQLKLRLAAIYPPGRDWTERMRKPRLRILGITSRYTTFLQFSMRDWLEAFERMGHQTRLLMESADHLLLGPAGVAQGVLDFQPDLVVVIDHYRAEMGTIPESLPCVMYVQDRLPNIFSAKAGQSQTARDYCLGLGRLHLSDRYGYPRSRFLSCPVGINEKRFEQFQLTRSDLERFGCDVSYVSHASRPADQIVREFAARSGSPQIARLCDHFYQRLEGWYAAGGIALSEVTMRQMLDRCMADVRVQLAESDVPGFVTFFNQSVNNAIFRHQTLNWLAGLGINLHIWGKGWEAHPTLSCFARGIADNQSDLAKIYRASKINIQVTPHGSVHQRLLDGLAAGGFFLLRWHPGDAVGRIYRELLAWCRENSVNSDDELHAKADGHVREIFARINYLEGSTPQTRVFSVFDVMNGHADSDFMTSADSIWDAYEQVAFNDGVELADKVKRFLGDDAARQQIAASMREAVIGRGSYGAINRRLLAMIQNDICSEVARCAA